MLFGALVLGSLGLGWIVIRAIRSVSSSGGVDKEARRTMTEMANREKAAADELAKPISTDPRDHAYRLRDLLRRRRHRSMSSHK